MKARGFSLGSTLLLTLVIVVLVFALASTTISHLQLNTHQENTDQARNLAVSAIHQALARLLADEEFGKTPGGEVLRYRPEGFPAESVGLLTFAVSVIRVEDSLHPAGETPDGHTDHRTKLRQDDTETLPIDRIGLNVTDEHRLAGTMDYSKKLLADLLTAPEFSRIETVDSPNLHLLGLTVAHQDDGPGRS